MYLFRINWEIPSKFNYERYEKQVDYLRNQVCPLKLKEVQIKYKFFVKSDNWNLVSKIYVINKLLKDYWLIKDTKFWCLKHIKATLIWNSKEDAHCDIKILTTKDK